jgi:hypothetical protein
MTENKTLDPLISEFASQEEAKRLCVVSQEGVGGD